MRISEILKSSVAALIKNKRRSILTMLGIIIGISAVITIMALGKGFELSMISNLTQSEGSDVVVNVIFRPDDSNLFSSSVQLYGSSDVELVQNIEGVAKVEIEEINRGFEILNGRSYYSDGDKGLMINRKKYVGPMLYGRNLDQLDLQNESTAVIVSKQTADEMYDGNIDAVGQTILLQGNMFKIVGVYKGADPMDFMNMERYDMYIPDSTYVKYFRPENSGNNLKVTLKPGVSPKTVTDEVLSKLKMMGTMKNSGSYTAFDMSMLTQGIGNVLQMITYFLSAIAGISLLIAGVGVMNMMYISVSERTREIGIRRALGATQSSIRNQFLFEGIIITSIGGFIGFITGVAGAEIISNFIPFRASVALNSIILTVVISITIGLVFSVMPANAAAKKDLIDIMR